MKFFAVSYTNRCKDYCEKEFFERFNMISEGHKSLVVDNTQGRNYFEHLTHLTKHVVHIDVPEGFNQFHRNVTDSVNTCRDYFLESDCDAMVIIESDVIPPVDLLSKFERNINGIQSEWGIIGGVYYTGVHDFSLEGLHRVPHALAGCTAYSRALLEKYSFRYDPSNLGPFPDAFICADSGHEFSIWNDHDIICKHLSLNGSRYSVPQ